MASPLNSGKEFYASIPAFTDFNQVINPSNYYVVPTDWLIFITDIEGSTTAIKQGRYKDVNIVGASSIIAVLNAIHGTEIPYVFGGDGASFLVPPFVEQPVIAALLATQTMALDAFDLRLRVAMVSCSVVNQFAPIEIAKYRLSTNIEMAMFSGGGLAVAEKLIKDKQEGRQYEIRSRNLNLPLATADFSGLECRWKPIEPTYGEVLTIIVKARKDESVVYSELLDQISTIYGDKEKYHPIKKKKLKMTFRLSKLYPESAVKNYLAGGFSVFKFSIKVLLQNIIGLIMMKAKISMGGFDGKNYKEDLIANSDFQKFDDMLRMVIDTSPGQAARLIQYLRNEHSQGKLYFGTHTADAALMTCLIFDRQYKHLHFLDGAAGGYTLAAAQLKSQSRQSDS